MKINPRCTIIDRKTVSTDKTYTDKSLSYYAGSGVFCYPNDPCKNISSLCASNLTEVFTITPDCENILKQIFYYR